MFSWRDELSSLTGNSALAPDAESHSDETFQKLMLDLSQAASQSSDASQVIRLFCSRTRWFFHCSGTYFWSRTPEGGLVGAEADGFQAEQFRGLRLKPGDSAVVLDAVQSRRTLFSNDVNLSHYPKLTDYGARAVLAAPLLVSDEVVGAIAFVHNVPDLQFDNDSAAKATILATQLGTALEALRLNLVSREEHRRAMILAEVATALHGLPDTASVMEGLADRLRVLLHSPTVLIFVHEEDSFRLEAIGAETPVQARAVRMRHQQGNLRIVTQIATRAVAAGECITVPMDAGQLGDEAPTGALIAAPFRTSRSHGAILVYPRQSAPFTAEEKTLVSALAGFGAVAIANAELYGMARSQAQDLHSILEISSEIGSAGKLDRFMQAFVLRASSFLGFRRCFIGMLEHDAFRLRWAVEDGRARPLDVSLTDSVGIRVLRNKQVFLTEDAASVPGANLEFVKSFKIKQLLAVPLLGSTGELLGMFGLLDRLQPGPIPDEDVRRARALAAQAAIAFELTHNLHQSEQHRKRAESLVALALELNTVLHLPEFTRNFARRAADLLGGRAVALSLLQGGSQETVLLQGASEIDDKPLLRRFNLALGGALTKNEADVVFAPAVELFGAALATSLGWNDCTLVRLAGASGELIGVLCLADRGTVPTAEDQQLLRAVASHASIALENACLFSRMEQANRHWVEVFDAISDFIVVHDEVQNILRVNRSLADFVGIAPEQLVGVNMRALDGLSVTGTSPRACPFCRNGEGFDEYIHPLLERTYLVSTSRIHAAASSQLQTVHVLKDITDRREAEQRYRELFDNIQEGIYFTTPQGRFVEVNDALVRILGYSSREELLQVDIPSAIYFDPERRKVVVNSMEADGRMRNHHEMLRRKDGSPVHVLINCFAVRDAKGDILQYRGLLLDVSGLHNSQTELQRERDFSSKILNYTQSLILVTDTKGVISYANRRWSGLGFAQSQLLGRAFSEFSAPARKDALQEALAAVAEGHQVDNFELQLLRGDGQSGQFSVNLSPISGDDGQASSIVVVMTDVTDSAMLQAKLIHTEKMAAVGQLVSGVAHEVNNPLTAILGFTDLLVESPDISDSARRDLRVILQEAQRTKQIVQNLLSFARQMPAQRLPVQLNAILRRTLQLRAYDFHSHGVEIIERLDESLPDVIGDAHQLQQVFLNIVNNAHDAVSEMSRPARIEIMSARNGNWVEVSFRDNGAGIEFPDRIFDPFFTTKEVGKGTGLGLSICYGIVREHGGEIVCHNNLDSDGATFIVRLPHAAEGAALGATAGVNPI